MQCVILAGGLGTRMAPLTDSTPKTLLTVAGRPFSDWQLEWLASEGVKKATYCIGHLGEQIRRHVRSGRQFGLQVDYVDEGQTPLGTGGALGLALENDALDDKFFVLYGDSYLCVNLRSTWETFNAISESALMTVYRNLGRWERSNASFADGLVTCYDKYATETSTDLCYVDYGLSLLRRSTVERWIPSASISELPTVFASLSAAGELAGVEVPDRFFEIGSRDGLKALEAFLESSPRTGNVRGGVSRRLS